MRPTPSCAERGSSAAYWASAAAVVVVQFILAAISFPFAEMWTDQPLFHIDGAFHWYQLKIAADLWEGGRLVGYDPYFGAGAVAGVNTNLSARLPGLLCAVLAPAIDEVRCYKGYVFAVTLFAPLALPTAAAVLRLRPVATSLASALGVAMWWGSYLHWYYTAGMVAYVGVTYLLVLYATMFGCYVRGELGGWWLVPLALLGAFGFFWHPMFPITAGIAVGACLVVCFRELDRKRTVAAVVLLPVASLLPNIFWLYPLWRYGAGYIDEAVYQRVVDAGRLIRELSGQLSTTSYGSKTYPLVAMGALWAVVGAPAGRIRSLWLAMIAGGAAIEAFAYLGAAIPGVAKLQPNRAAPAGYLLLCIPAASGFVRLGRACAGRDRSTYKSIAIGCGAGALLIGTMVTIEVAREALPGHHGRYGADPPLVRPIGDDSAALLNWLRQRTTADSRILFENSLGRVHDSAHMAGFYAHQSQREFVGGPYPFMYFAGFWDRRAFTRDLSEIGHEQMNQYFTRYNIGAVVVHSDTASRYFHTMPGVRPDFERGQLVAFVVERKPSFFLKGQGHVVERAHSRVVLQDVSGEDVVLSYHYVPGLVTEPRQPIEGIVVGDDPTPFVRIRNPAPRFVLYFQ